ncbi:ABC transporter ATP-binding protein [Lysinibacter sp. HNR]|uniref:ABC transporter ATP-binding protein n=1 Tax=Lysinibacter sp. HNR TaxID=3031408 RepID=UPI0024348BD4|nr:ABC transporter ATP-binding protein [Lysinibacter sp. HNR]WGD38246.1 ABC transporter ATP-binding protein [Lysinibacter sp. HNR]
MVLMRLLAHQLRPHWLLLVWVVVFQLAQALLSLYLPTLNANIIDQGVARGDTGYIMSTGGFMLVLTLLQVICSITAVYFGAKTAMRVGRDLRTAIFHRVGEFSEREVSQFGAPSLITRNTNDVQQVQMFVLMTCTLLISAPILAVGGIAMAMRQDLELSWLIAVSVPVLLLAVSAIIVKMVPLFQLMQERIDNVNRVLREQLVGIRVVRAFVREPLETRRFEVANEEVTDAGLRAGRLFALMFPVVMLVLNVSSVAVIWFGAFRIEDRSMEIGTLTAFLTYLMQILMSVMMATFMAVLAPRAAVCAKRISEILHTESSVTPPEDPVEPSQHNGSITLKEVDFSYPGAEQAVLSNISFTATPGQTTAIIGSTGSGKTTLINLLPRLFDVTGGSVVIDGVDIRRMNPESLWTRIGLVPQKPYLFSGTVASNLRYGRPEASDEELWAALKTAQAEDFVRAMPHGLESLIAQGGTNVSGGQRQRLAIARALVKKSEIYVFDDSFSALDLATDARLRAALARDIGHATLVIVAQRVSTIVGADQILVLEDGEIVGRGTHDELLANNKTYAEIVSSQLVAEEAL